MLIGRLLVVFPFTAENCQHLQQDHRAVLFIGLERGLLGTKQPTWTNKMDADVKDLFKGEHSSLRYFTRLYFITRHVSIIRFTVDVTFWCHSTTNNFADDTNRYNEGLNFHLFTQILRLLPVWRAGSGRTPAWSGLWAGPASLWPGSPRAGSLALPLSSSLSPSPSLHPSSPSHPPELPIEKKIELPASNSNNYFPLYALFCRSFLMILLEHIYI